MTAVAVAVAVQEADAAEQEKLNKIIDDKVQARLKKDPASTTTNQTPMTSLSDRHLWWTPSVSLANAECSSCDDQKLLSDPS